MSYTSWGTNRIILNTSKAIVHTPSWQRRWTLRLEFVCDIDLLLLETVYVLNDAACVDGQWTVEGGGTVHELLARQVIDHASVVMLQRTVMVVPGITWSG